MTPADPVAIALLAAVAEPFGDSERDRLIAAVGACTSPQRLLEASRRHGVDALLHWRLRGAALAPAITAGLARAFGSNTRRSMVLSGMLVRVFDAFANAGVRALPLKGPLLAARYSEHPALRRCSDLDVLAHDADLKRAQEVLEALGFTTPPNGGIVDRRVRRFRAHDKFWHAASGVCLELHWRLAVDDFAFAFPAEALLARSRPWTWQGRSIPMLAPEDLVLTLAVHGSRHHWSRLEWRHIFARVLRHERLLDWAEVWSEARRLGVARMLGFALLVAHEQAPTAVPPEALRLARGDRGAWRAAEGLRLRPLGELESAAPDPTASEPLWRRLPLRERFQDRASLVWRALTVPGPGEAGPITARPWRSLRAGVRSALGMTRR